jgi:hypothetical protein
MTPPVGAVIGFAESGVPAICMVEVVGVIVVWPLAGAASITVIRAMKNITARNAVHRMRAAISFLYAEFKGLPFDLVIWVMRDLPAKCEAIHPLTLSRLTRIGC